jgi:hypothetical protein
MYSKPQCKAIFAKDSLRVTDVSSLILFHSKTDDYPIAEHSVDTVDLAEGNNPIFPSSSYGWNVSKCTVISDMMRVLRLLYPEFRKFFIAHSAK